MVSNVNGGAYGSRKTNLHTTNSRRWFSFSIVPIRFFPDIPNRWSSAGSHLRDEVLHERGVSGG